MSDYLEPLGELQDAPFYFRILPVSQARNLFQKIVQDLHDLRGSRPTHFANGNNERDEYHFNLIQYSNMDLIARIETEPPESRIPKSTIILTGSYVGESGKMIRELEQIAEKHGLTQRSSRASK